MSKQDISTENLLSTPEQSTGATVKKRRYQIPPMTPRGGNKFTETAASIAKDRQYERRDCRRFDMCLADAAIMDAVCIPCELCTAFHIPTKKRRTDEALLRALGADPWRLKD